MRRTEAKTTAVDDALAILRASRLANIEIAALIPTSERTVARWRLGTNKPSRYVAHRILAALKSPMGRRASSERGP
jgi:DNA-binding transcriptional regulator YiaG